jgi:hypothetical protein
MNRLFIFFVVSIVSCANSTSDKTEGISKNNLELINKFDIDTLVINEDEYKDICFVIDESNIPKIKGLVDKTFENKLNQIFKNNFDSHIKEAKKEYGDCIETDDIETYEFNNIPNSAGSLFEVLNKSDSIISIVQFMFAYVGNGGNARVYSSTTLTANLNTKIIYSNKEFKVDWKNKDYLNTRIKIFFDKLNASEENNILYPYIKTNDDFNRLNFGIRNDSLMLITEANPSYSATYGTYIIPIDLINNLGK